MQIIFDVAVDDLVALNRHTLSSMGMAFGWWRSTDTSPLWIGVVPGAGRRSPMRSKW